MNDWKKACIVNTKLIYIASSLRGLDFQISNFTRPEGGDNTSSISPTDNAVKLFIWKSIYKKASEFRSKGKTHLCGWTLSLKLLILIRTMEKDA